jgi:MFS transporter, ACS family, allantoate permease
MAGLVVFFYLPDSPVKARRFTDAEKVATLLRVKDNQSGTQNAKIKRSQILQTFKDPGVYLVAVSVVLLSVPTAIPNFSSILLTTFGYSSQQAVSWPSSPLIRFYSVVYFGRGAMLTPEQLILNIPGGVVGAVSTILIGYLSDKWNDRSLVMIIAILPTIAAFAMMIGLDPGAIAYFVPSKIAVLTLWIQAVFQRARALSCSRCISATLSHRYAHF